MRCVQVRAHAVASICSTDNEDSPNSGRCRRRTASSNTADASGRGLALATRPRPRKPPPRPGHTARPAVSQSLQVLMEGKAVPQQRGPSSPDCDARLTAGSTGAGPSNVPHGHTCEVCGPPRSASSDLRLGDTGPQTRLRRTGCLLPGSQSRTTCGLSRGQRRPTSQPRTARRPPAPHLAVTLSSGNFSVRCYKFGDSSCGHSEGPFPLGDRDLQGQDFKDTKVTHATCAGQIRGEKTRSVPQPVTEGFAGAPVLHGLTAASVPHCHPGASAKTPRSPPSSASG